MLGLHASLGLSSCPTMGGLPASLSLRFLIYEMETVLPAHVDEMDEDKEGPQGLLSGWLTTKK